MSSLESFDAHKRQDKVRNPEESENATEQHADKSEKAPEQLLAELEAEKETVTEEIDQLRATLDSVDQSKLTESERTLWEKISAAASDAKRFVEDFASKHPTATSAALLAASIASAYLCLKNFDAYGGTFINLGQIRAFGEGIFVPGPEYSASATIGLAMGAVTSALTAFGSFMTLAENVLTKADAAGRRKH